MATAVTVVSSPQAIPIASVFAAVVNPAKGNPVQLVKVPLDGVPKTGVI